MSTIVFYFTLAGVAFGLAGSAFHWVVPDTSTLLLLAGAGLIAGGGQLWMTEAARVAPLGVIAPFDYTQLVWAIGLGLIFWGGIPHPRTIIGAIVVAGSGLYILYRELRRSRPG